MPLVFSHFLTHHLKDAFDSKELDAKGWQKILIQRQAWTGHIVHFELIRASNASAGLIDVITGVEWLVIDGNTAAAMHISSVSAPMKTFSG